jgi:hypothetical protein
VLFEAAPEETARRVTEALVAAEHGDAEAWRWLDDSALHRLRADAEYLVNLVPFAFICLTQQLALHPRSAARIDAVRYATLAGAYAPEAASRILTALSSDASRGVRNAAAQALARFVTVSSGEPISMGDVVEVSDSV